MITLMCANSTCYNLTSDVVSGYYGITPPEGWEQWMDTRQQTILYFCCQECKQAYVTHIEGD